MLVRWTHLTLVSAALAFAATLAHLVIVTRPTSQFIYYVFLISILYIPPALLVLAFTSIQGNIKFRNAIAVIVKADVALVLVILLVSEWTERSGHSSPLSGARVVFLWIAIIWVSVFNALALLMAWPEDRIIYKPIVLPLFVGLLAGWAVAVAVWSETIPSKLISQAETLAGDKPYCIAAGGKGQAKSRRDLVAWVMFPPESQGWTWSFHALLVIAGEPKRYFNWSYKYGGFQKLEENSVERLVAIQDLRCELTPYFATKLPAW